MTEQLPQHWCEDRQLSVGLSLLNGIATADKISRMPPSLLDNYIGKWLFKIRETSDFKSRARAVKRSRRLSIENLNRLLALNLDKDRKIYKESISVWAKARKANLHKLVYSRSKILAERILDPTFSSAQIISIYSSTFEVALWKSSYQDSRNALAKLNSKFQKETAWVGQIGDITQAGESELGARVEWAHIERELVNRHFIFPMLTAEVAGNTVPICYPVLFRFAYTNAIKNRNAKVVSGEIVNVCTQTIGKQAKYAYAAASEVWKKWNRRVEDYTPIESYAAIFDFSCAEFIFQEFRGNVFKFNHDSPSFHISGESAGLSFGLAILGEISKNCSDGLIASSGKLGDRWHNKHENTEEFTLKGVFGTPTKLSHCLETGSFQQAFLVTNDHEHHECLTTPGLQKALLHGFKLRTEFRPSHANGGHRFSEAASLAFPMWSQTHSYVDCSDIADHFDQKLEDSEDGFHDEWAFLNHIAKSKRKIVRIPERFDVTTIVRALKLVNRTISRNVKDQEQTQLHLGRFVFGRTTPYESSERFFSSIWRELGGSRSQLAAYLDSSSPFEAASRLCGVLNGKGIFPRFVPEILVIFGCDNLEMDDHGFPSGAYQRFSLNQVEQILQKELRTTPKKQIKRLVGSTRVLLVPSQCSNRRCVDSKNITNKELIEISCLGREFSYSTLRNFLTYKNAHPVSEQEIDENFESLWSEKHHGERLLKKSAKTGRYYFSSDVDFEVTHTNRLQMARTYLHAAKARTPILSDEFHYWENLETSLSSRNAENAMRNIWNFQAMAFGYTDSSHQKEEFEKLRTKSRVMKRKLYEVGNRQSWAAIERKLNDRQYRFKANDFHVVEEMVKNHDGDGNIHPYEMCLGVKACIRTSEEGNISGEFLEHLGASAKMWLNQAKKSSFRMMSSTNNQVKNEGYRSRYLIEAAKATSLYRFETISGRVEKIGDLVVKNIRNHKQAPIVMFPGWYSFCGDLAGLDQSMDEQSRNQLASQLYHKGLPEVVGGEFSRSFELEILVKYLGALRLADKRIPRPILSAIRNLNSQKLSKCQEMSRKFRSRHWELFEEPDMESKRFKDVKIDIRSRWELGISSIRYFSQTAL